MALSIKDTATDELARQLATATGSSITDAIKTALTGELRRVRGREPRKPMFDELTAIARRCASLPVLDARNPDVVRADL